MPATAPRSCETQVDLIDNRGRWRDRGSSIPSSGASRRGGKEDGEIPCLATQRASPLSGLASEISPTPSAFFTTIIFYDHHLSAVPAMRLHQRAQPKNCTAEELRSDPQEFGLTSWPRPLRRLTGMRRPSSLHSIAALAWIS